MDRLDWLRSGIPLDAPGIEIGPLDRAILPRPGFSVLYADHLPREGLQAKYAQHPGVDTTAIPHIDFVIGEAGLLDAVGERKFHYLLASHVIEHVPNPIRWLNEIHSMLEDGGIIGLAIPDHRRCFDALRRLSTPGEWIEAYLLDHTRPSPSRIFDALANEVKCDGQISWHHDPAVSELKLSRTGKHALQIARQNLVEGSYFDVHCWTFTPESFCNLMRVVASVGLVKLGLVDITGTHGHEFLVRLRRDDSMDPNLVPCSYPAHGGRYDLLPADFNATVYLSLNPDVAAAGVDPNDHYVEYGAREGRRYR